MLTRHCLPLSSRSFISPEYLEGQGVKYWVLSLSLLLFWLDWWQRWFLFMPFAKWLFKLHTLNWVRCPHSWIWLGTCDLSSTEHGRSDHLPALRPRKQVKRSLKTLPLTKRIGIGKHFREWKTMEESSFFLNDSQTTQKQSCLGWSVTDYSRMKTSS